MLDPKELRRPWLVAVWPGMGNVGITAGYYLMAKLGMQQVSEFSARELFDVDHVEVDEGIIQLGRRPRSRIFAWKDPQARQDIVVFLGEAQPPTGKYEFCRRLLEFAKTLGVERVFTFAAMATQMHPTHDSRVFAASTDQKALEDLQNVGVEIVKEGQIGGLNGVVLGVAGEMGLPGTCLLGEMPHVFAQLPFPKASLAVLRVFTELCDVEIDLDELAQQAAAIEERLGDFLAKIEEAMNRPKPEEAEEETLPAPQEERGLSAEDEQRIERLFDDARQDRSKAYELKNELDRLGVFRDYEDRFLDLFKPTE